MEEFETQLREQNIDSYLGILDHMSERDLELSIKNIRKRMEELSGGQDVLCLVKLQVVHSEIKEALKNRFMLNLIGTS